MKLRELKERVDFLIELSERNNELEVGIPNNSGGMGGIPITAIKYVGKGIDWNAGTFLIWPENDMIEKPKK